MSTSPDPQQEHPGTYVVQSHSKEEELIRLHKQDQWVTACMGGVLAEQADTTALRRVLDIGCGTGDWLLETARTYPDIPVLIGVDISNHLVQFARHQAEAQQLDHRVEFQVMDALRPLEFPNAHFDLVNARSATAYLRTWDWPKFLQECRRVSQADGIVRISEPHMAPHSTSPALTRLLGIALEALYRAGHFLTPEGDSNQQKLPGLMEQCHFQNVRSRTYRTVTRTGTEEWQLACSDMQLLFRTIVPFLQKWLQIPDDYQEIYQQMLREMQQPDFELTTVMVTTWGTTPFEPE